MPIAEKSEEIMLDNVQKVQQEKQSKHVPSTVQADTLFTFVDQLDWIIEPLRLKMISPRYCVENIRYLHLGNLKEIAIPMKCFCDINMHKLGVHLDWYGYYGLAFSKEWGMKKGIQPVRYINPDSPLCKDFTTAFKAALKDKSKKNPTQKKLQNYILHDLMYCKPYAGLFENRRTKKRQQKCYTDECEWRFVPDVTMENYDQVIFDDEILHTGNLVTISNAMNGLSDISLTFEYSDIKYIIVDEISDLNKITSEILKFDIDESAQHELISKIIVWNISKGDF